MPFSAARRSGSATTAAARATAASAGSPRNHKGGAFTGGVLTGAGAVQATSSAAGAAASRGRSLLPTTVRFSPICTDTMVPSMSMVVFSLRFQPSEPVENSLTPTTKVRSPMVTLIGLALARNWARVTGHEVFFAMTFLLAGARGASLPSNAAASYHATAAGQGRLPRRGGFPSPRSRLQYKGSTPTQG